MLGSIIRDMAGREGGFTASLTHRGEWDSLSRWNLAHVTAGSGTLLGSTRTIDYATVTGASATSARSPTRGVERANHIKPVYFAASKQSHCPSHTVLQN